MIINSIQLFPIKSLDRVVVNQAKVTTGQALEFDRRWAIHRKRDGRTVNGKKYPAVHQLRALFELEERVVHLQAPQQAAQKFALVGDFAPLNEYLSDYFGEAVEVSEDEHRGFPDHTTANVGASLVSRQTLQQVGAWFDLPEEEVNRRMRMNFVVDASAAFEEDKLLAQNKEQPNAFNFGKVEVWPYKPCVRCPVPTRDSQNGEAIRGFQKEYVQRRLALQPQLLEHPLYAHAYMCGIVLIIPEASVGQIMEVGMPITPKM
jgi:uncharacterized protein YcbX